MMFLPRREKPKFFHPLLNPGIPRGEKLVGKQPAEDVLQLVVGVFGNLQSDADPGSWHG